MAFKMADLLTICASIVCSTNVARMARKQIIENQIYQQLHGSPHDRKQDNIAVPCSPMPEVVLIDEHEVDEASTSIRIMPHLIDAPIIDWSMLFLKEKVFGIGDVIMSSAKISVPS